MGWFDAAIPLTCGVALRLQDGSAGRMTREEDPKSHVTRGIEKFLASRHKRCALSDLRDNSDLHIVNNEGAE
jgi:hypothetical protein